MELTALEKFIQQIEEQGESWENVSIGRIQISIKVEDYLDLIEQAKEMEKEQQDEFAIGFAEWCLKIRFEPIENISVEKLLEIYKKDNL
jgi:hypothetical protein